MSKNYLEKKVPKKENHVRWNYEIPEDRNAVLYHFVVLGDRDYRNSKLNEIFENLRDYGGIELVRSSSENISKAGRRYSFRSLETNVRPDVLNWDKIETDNGRVIKDKKLREKHIKGYSIEDYVADTYNK